MQIKTRAKFVSAILDFYHGPKLWIPDACERVHIFALNAPGLNLEAPSSKIDDFLHCAAPSTILSVFTFYKKLVPCGEN